MATQLEIIAEQQRKEHLSRNPYDQNGGYNSVHTNAISDGDEKGKSEIGSSKDIIERTQLIGKNPYNENNAYNSGNINA